MLGRKKLTYDYVKNFIESKGYKLISTEYVRALDKITIQCPEGHMCYIAYADFHQGWRCPYCVLNTKYTYDEVKEYIESEGYILISKEYKDSKTRLKIQCPKGHEFRRIFNIFKNRRRCPICEANEKNNTKYTKSFIKQFIIDEGYDSVLDEYQNDLTDLLVRFIEGYNSKDLEES